MKVVILAPLACNQQQIATHTAKITAFLRQMDENKVTVDTISFSDNGSDDHVRSYDRNCLSDYQDAADRINANFDVCLLQYASGAYGGYAGSNIISLVSHLQVPLVTAVHRVESEPSAQEKGIVGFLAKRSQRILTFSQLGLDFLEHHYKISRDKLFRTHIGVTAFNPLSPDERNNRVGIDTSRMIVAWNEMCPASGFETIINALPAVLKSYADTTLLIINASPKSQANDEYARVLLRQAVQRGVLPAIRIINQDDVKDDLEQLMQAADAFVAAGVNEKCLEGMYLSMAVGSGAAILSTPTWFAKEILDEQRGHFFAFRSATELSAELIAMLRNSKEVQGYRENAILFGAQHSSGVVATKLAEVLKAAEQTKLVPIDPHFNLALYPQLNLQFIHSLADNTGYLKQSLHGVADLKAGYCIGTNAMALQVFVKAYRSTNEMVYLKGIKKCLGFIQLMCSESGIWSSSLNHAGEVNGVASQMALGQVINALGSMYVSLSDVDLKDMAYSLVLQILQEHELDDAKALALGVCGLAQILKVDAGNQFVFEVFEQWSGYIKDLFPAEHIRGWQWFEDELSEQLGLLPYALLLAYEWSHEESYLSIAKRAIRFIEKQVLTEERFVPRFEGVSKENDKPTAMADQMANEGFWFTLTYAKLYEVTNDASYLKKAVHVHNWYLGDNTIGKSLLDIYSGGCYRALSGRSVDPLMTLEATSAYWLSHFALSELYFKHLIG